MSSSRRAQTNHFSSSTLKQFPVMAPHPMASLLWTRVEKNSGSRCLSNLFFCLCLTCVLGLRFQAWLCSQSSSAPLDIGYLLLVGISRYAISSSILHIVSCSTRRCEICFLSIIFNDVKNSSPCGLDYAFRSMDGSTCVLRVTKWSRSLLTSASFPTSTYRIRSRRMSACSKAFFDILNPLPYIRMPSQKSKPHTRSVRRLARGRTPSGTTVICISWRQLGTCLINYNGDKHDYASTRLAREFPASTMQNCCHGGLRSSWKSSKTLHRTAIREKLFPVQSAETGIRTSGGVLQDHLSHQTLLCKTDTNVGGRHRNLAKGDLASRKIFFLSSFVQLCRLHKG